MRAHRKRLVGSAAGTAFALVALASGSVQADAQHGEFTGGVGASSPCNGDAVGGSGPVKVHVNETVTAAGAEHVTVHLTFRFAGGDYHGSYIANGQFEAIAETYDVEYHANFVGGGSIPDFTAEGVVRVFMNGDVPAGAGIQSASYTCTNG